MKPKQFFFVLIGIVAVIVAAGGYGYYMALTRLHSQAGQLAEKMAEEKAEEDQLESLDKLNHQYNRDVKPNLSLIQDFLPQHKLQSEILAQIERVAVSTGVTQPFQSVSMPGPTGLPSEVSQTSADGVVLALPINFVAQGSYSELQQFTAELENLNRYTNVTTLQIDHGTKSGPISYTFSLNAYIKP